MQRASAFKKDLVTVVWGTLAGLILAVALTTGPLGLPFVDNLGAKVPNILGALLIVSIFAERVVEVFVSIWRDPESDLLEEELNNWQVIQLKRRHEIKELLAEMEAAPSARKTMIEVELGAKRRELTQAEEKEENVGERLVPLKARTRQVSTWMAVTVGMLICVVGYRFFHQIVDVSRLASSARHESWFVFVDVLLSGLVIAGGAKAVHYLFALYDAFMESTRRRAGRAR